MVGDGGLRVYISNYGNSPQDIDIQTESVQSESHNLQDICFGNNRFVAVGGKQPGTNDAHLSLWTKQIDQNWNDHSKEGEPIGSCVYGENFFVGISTNEQTPVHSLAGIQWQEGNRTPWIQDTLHDIAFGQDLFIAVGDQGRISKSIDGSEWFTDISIGNLDIYRIIYAQSRFVGVGEFGFVISSPDGIHWTENMVGTNNFSHIVYGNDAFLISNGMMIYRSTDTVVWEEWKESDIKLLAQIGSFIFGYKGQDLYRTDDENLLSWELISSIPNGLTIQSAHFEVRP